MELFLPDTNIFFLVISYLGLIQDKNTRYL